MISVPPFRLSQTRTRSTGHRHPEIISIDAEKGKLNVKLSKAELERRRKKWKPRKHDYQSGALWRYAQTVGNAREGAVVHPGGKAETHTYADI